MSMLDAAESIASKINGKMVLYYTFLLTNRIKKLKPLPLLEILTNSYDEKPIKWCLDAFLKDEKERYGHKVSSTSLIFTCDMLWPIIKAALRVCNNESIVFVIMNQSRSIAKDSIRLPQEMQLAKSCLLRYPKPLFTFVSRMS